MLGLGNDIIEIERVARLIKNHGQRFLDRTFSPDEQSYCLNYADSDRRFAGRFAAKEAIAKALGTGFREEVSWTGIEILSDPQGKPYVRLSQEIQERFGALNILISISHCKEYAAAVSLITN